MFSCIAVESLLLYDVSTLHGRGKIPVTRVVERTDWEGGTVLGKMLVSDRHWPRMPRGQEQKVDRRPVRMGDKMMRIAMRMTMTMAHGTVIVTIVDICEGLCQWHIHVSVDSIACHEDCVGCMEISLVIQ